MVGNGFFGFYGNRIPRFGFGDHEILKFAIGLGLCLTEKVVIATTAIVYVYVYSV